jgi:NAD(P)-dependent dehydrogenase (short-subunit alcohol dehydrogenase family)
MFFDLVKVGVIRLAYGMAQDLAGTGVSAVAVTPGYLRSEAMLERFGVTEASWRDQVKKDRHFAESETPWYVGRAVAALAADPNVRAKSGKAFASGTLANEYGFDDRDGRRPDWVTYFDREVAAALERGAKDADDRFFLLVGFYNSHLDPARFDRARRIADVLGIEVGRP